MAKETEKPQAQEIERRVLTVEDVELRVDDGDQRRLTGYAAKFGKWSEDLGGFREKIAKGAFADVLRDDVRCLKNHDPNLILGRTTSGTLKIEENSVGLRFTADLPDTTTGRDTAEEVRRGDISGCSFSFRVLEDDWKYLEDGSIERTILRFKSLYDVGPVTYPAYPDTSVAARSLEAFRRTHQAPGPEARTTSDEPVTEEPKPIVAEPSKPISRAEMTRLRRESEILKNYLRSPEV